MTTRRKRARADAAPFPMILGDDGEFHDADETTNEGGKQPGAEEALAALQARFDSLTNEMQQMRDMQAAVASYRPPTIAAEPPKPITFDDLPNPVDDPAGYGTALANKYATFLSEKEAYEAAQREQAQRVDSQTANLWAGFRADETYAPYAADEDKVEFAASKAIERAVARGLDPQSYMYKSRSAFYKDVATEYDRVFGKPTLGGDDDDFEDDADDGRTAGLMGGTGGKGRMSDAAEEPGPDMFAELRNWQIKTGFHA